MTPARDGPSSQDGDAARGAADRRALDDNVAQFIHGALLQNIALADRKAGILFTLLSAALLYLFTRMPVTVASWLGALWIGVSILLVAAAGCAFFVILPRRMGSGTIFFWGRVAGYGDRETFIREVRARDGATLTHDKLTYCHDLARVCARKFTLLRYSMILTAVGLILFLLELALYGAGRDPGAAPPVM